MQVFDSAALPLRMTGCFGAPGSRGMGKCAFLAPILRSHGIGAASTRAHAARGCEAVNVFVNVTDRNGAIVGGLTREDFALTEDGRPQRIAIFERQSELPLHLTLAIDTSGSVSKDMAVEAVAARRFAHALLRSQDQMSLLQFATEVRELCPSPIRVSQTITAGPVARRFGDGAYDRICVGSQRRGGNAGRKVAGAHLRRRRHRQHGHLCPGLEQALRNEAMIYSIIDCAHRTPAPGET